MRISPRLWMAAAALWTLSCQTPQQVVKTDKQTSITAVAGKAKQPAYALTRYVDPFIGTGGHGHTFPGPTMPFGMVQLSPDTGIEGWDWCSGYHDSDNSIMGFSHTHLSGTGGPDYGDVLLMPTVGAWKITPGSKQDPDQGYRSRFSKESEKAFAGYYSVMLQDYGVQAELTATPRVGVHRYTFPKSGESNIVIDLKHGISDSAKETWLQVTGTNEIRGMRRSQGWASDQYVYFVARFSKPFSTYATAVEDQLKEGVAKAEGKDAKAVVRFATKQGEQVTVKVAISAVDMDGALRNLEQEVPGWDFDAVQQQAELTWQQRLEQVQVEGGREEDRKVFYSALYHTMVAPNNYTDVDGRYRGMDGMVHRSQQGKDYYTLFSLWDTYRATHPLYTLLAPQENAQFVHSMLRKFEQGGELPVWELASNETYTMIGSHAIPVIADAILKGQVPDVDLQLALKAMKASVEQQGRGYGYYRRMGFIPQEKESNSVSKQVEYAYDDWCVAQVARLAGNTADYHRYLRGAESYKQLFDPAVGFIRARDQYGMWSKDFDPMRVSLFGSGDYTEGNAWHYSFYAPQDVNGLINLYGGKKAFEAKLDALFEQEAVVDNEHAHDVSGLIGQYAHGNEPSHHVAYLYNYVGAPYKAQARVRQILQEQYAAARDGLSGNEDCGQMSAWYVLSAMGFYPVNPASGEYIMGSPLFDKVTIKMPGGKTFTINASGNASQSPYIQSAMLHGKPLERTFLTHEEIAKGGSLDLVMSDTPSAWGTAHKAHPVSFAVPVGTSLPAEQPRLFMPFTVAEHRIFSDQLEVALSNHDAQAAIHYTLDGSEPTERSARYQGPFTLRQSGTLKTRAYKAGMQPSEVMETEFVQAHFKAPGSQQAYPVVSLAQPPMHRASAKPEALNDGLYGSENYQDGRWSGIQREDFVATVDLGERKQLNRLQIGFLENTGSWIFLPTAVEFLVSDDGKEFRSLGSEIYQTPTSHPVINVRRFARRAVTQARYVRVVAKSIGQLPAWHPGAGGGVWMFTDELVIE